MTRSTFTRKRIEDFLAVHVTPVEVVLMEQLFVLRSVAWVTWVLRTASRLGDWPLWLATGLLLLAAGGDAERLAVLSFGVALGLSVTVFMAVKHLIGRPRPFETWAGVTCLMAPPDKFSFPSGPTMTAFAVWANLFMLLPWISPLFLAMAVLIALSRVFLGLHYPTDVLVGALLGSGIGYAVARMTLALL